MTQVINPTDKDHWLSLRTQDITSTEIGALFGISPYCTLFELWHRKKNATVTEIEPSERMRWGNRLEAAIANGIAEDNGWSIRRMTEYIRISDLRMGSSFDYEYEVPDDGVNPKDGWEKGVLEIKNVDALAFKEGWIISGESVEAPPHIELQVQHQFAVLGHERSTIGALIGGNRVVQIKRVPDPAIIQAIKEKVASFWLSIAQDQEPLPDFRADADFIGKLYGGAEPGKVITADEKISSMAKEYSFAQKRAKEADEIKAGIKAELLTMIGDAEKVVGDGFSITAGIIPPAWIEAYERKGYRGFRVNTKKEPK